MATNYTQLPSYPVTQPIGFGIIIVNKFQNIPSHKRRGAEREVENLSVLFSLLGLQTKVYEDLTSHQIVEQLVNVSRDTALSSHSLMAVAIRLETALLFLYSEEDRVKSMVGPGIIHMEQNF